MATKLLYFQAPVWNRICSLNLLPAPKKEFRVWNDFNICLHNKAFDSLQSLLIPPLNLQRVTSVWHSNFSSSHCKELPVPADLSEKPSVRLGFPVYCYGLVWSKDAYMVKVKEAAMKYTTPTYLKKQTNTVIHTSSLGVIPMA